jgi:DNA mismatch repair protein MutL
MNAPSIIRTLPAQLANQIAAGEVVERPSSVVKELLENSLDAGATVIDIEIDKGGHKRIAIRDNGKGISKEDLKLALSRHATSKIASLDDLESVTSMGFRGEALASISAVSRLTLTSRIKNQSEAWQAQAEGRDMAVKITPAAHPVGTSLLVEDLFFNTPARRKFLKSEKTEFMHIDEVIRRIVLSRFDVSVSVKHNGKLLRKYMAVNDDGDPFKRLSKACGQKFCDNAFEVESQYQEMHLKGWLVDAQESQTVVDTQYFYVNGRIMRDKLINHAIKQAFSLTFGPDVMASYILYLTLPAESIDINVHPSKHEVRFHQARLVHDFIVRTVQEFLAQASDLQEIESEEIRNERASYTKVFEETLPDHAYIKPLIPADKEVAETSGHYHSVQHSRSPSYNPSAGNQYRQLLQSPPIEEVERANARWLTLANRQLLVQQDELFYLVSHAALYASVIAIKLSNYLPTAQPLLLPISVSISSGQGSKAQHISTLLAPLNIDLNVTSKKLLLRKVPAGMRELDWVSLLSHLLELDEDKLNGEPALTLLTEALAVSELIMQNREIEQHFLSLSSDELTNMLHRYASPLPLQNWLDGRLNE